MGSFEQLYFAQHSGGTDRMASAVSRSVHDYVPAGSCGDCSLFAPGIADSGYSFFNGGPFPERT